MQLVASSMHLKHFKAFSLSEKNKETNKNWKNTLKIQRQAAKPRSKS